jgi:hypothetical protein
MDKDVVWVLGRMVLIMTLHRGIGVVRACEVKACEARVCEAKVREAEAVVSDMVGVDRRSGREEFPLRMILTGTGSVLSIRYQR